MRSIQGRAARINEKCQFMNSLYRILNNPDSFDLYQSVTVNAEELNLKKIPKQEQKCRTEDFACDGKANF